MKKSIFILLVIIIIGLVACKPAHDNEWDPDNPNKAILSGFVYGLNDQPIPNAEIMLLQDTFVCDTAWSDVNGAYEITEIDPGLYRLVAYAPHYLPYEHCELESLPADTVAEHDVWFTTQYYCFEEEVLGTIQPYGFDTVSGIWAVINDDTDPDFHTTPNVYHGERTAAGYALALLKNSGPDFHLETKFKVLNSSGSGWMTGAVFGYHGDSTSYYFVGITHLGIGFNKRTPSGIDTLQVIPHTFLLDTWYDLVIQMCGSSINIYADGAEIAYTDSLPISGKAGLWIENFGGPAMVNFDDVIIGR